MIKTFEKAGFVLLFLLFICSNVSQADTVYLKSGRILTGKVSEDKAEKGGAFILLETESGAFYKLDKGDIVKTILKFDKSEIDYKKRLPLVRDIATDHVDIAKWCEKQDRGKTRFKEQIRWHYENVVRLEPDHSTARKKLGYIVLADGNWVAEAEFKSRQGYAKDRRHWISGLSAKVKANEDEYDAKFGAKKKEFNMWVRAAEKGNIQPGVLESICDNSTIFLVYHSARDASNEEFIRAHLDAIAKVKSGTAIEMIANFAKEHHNKNVREHAIALLSQSDMNKSSAVLYLARGLTSTNRGIVRAAAFAIGEVAASDANGYSRDQAIVPLAKALITTHDVDIPGALEAGRMSNTFGPGGTSFRTGGGPQTRKQDFKNQASLDALRRLFTEVRFEFDEQAWLDWYIQNYTRPELNVRGEE